MRERAAARAARRGVGVRDFPPPRDGPRRLVSPVAHAMRIAGQAPAYYLKQRDLSRSVPPGQCLGARTQPIGEKIARVALKPLQVIIDSGLSCADRSFQIIRCVYLFASSFSSGRREPDF